MTIDQPAVATRSPPIPPPAFGRELLSFVWPHRRKLAVVALVLLSLLPVWYVFSRAAEARRDIVYWDEFDTALAFVLKLKAGTTPGAFLQDLFQISNEHRTVTSRFLFAGTYWLTGTIDFALIGLIGNGTIVAMCLLLVAAAGPGLRRLRLAVLLAALMFQLEHYENFLWSGSSIDHFQVVLFATAALIALTRATTGGAVVGGLAATLATFTLAHGMAVWPVGAAMLWRAGRRRDLWIWCGLGLLAVGGFFTGFKLNGAESFVGFSPEGALKIARYWLAILGAVPALGSAKLAPWFGGALLLLQAYVISRGALRRERVVLPLALFALVAAGLIAIGRAEHSGGQVYSRYYVLGALAWALGLFMVLERHTHPRRPLQVLAALLPTLIAFNLLANRDYSTKADSWLTCRDIAAISYKQHGADGNGSFNLHPVPEHATALLQQAEALGVYRLGPICLRVPFPRRAQESDRIRYFVDEISVDSGAAAVRGWAAIPRQESRRGSIHLVLRSTHSIHLFTTVTIPRPDVPAATKQEGWTNAGFHFARRQAHLPAGDFQIGLLIMDGGHAEYLMTGHRLALTGKEATSAQ